MNTFRKKRKKGDTAYKYTIAAWVRRSKRDVQTSWKRRCWGIKPRKQPGISSGLASNFCKSSVRWFMTLWDAWAKRRNLWPEARKIGLTGRYGVCYNKAAISGVICLAAERIAAGRGRGAGGGSSPDIMFHEGKSDEKSRCFNDIVFCNAGIDGIGRRMRFFQPAGPDDRRRTQGSFADA